MKTSLGILNIAALLLTVSISYLSNLGFLNGETMASISAKHQTLFTPAGYAFSIWGIIYLALTGFVIYYSPGKKRANQKEKVVLAIGWWFVVSSVANSLWVVTWMYGYTFISIILMLLIFASLLIIIQKTKTEVKNCSVKTWLLLQLPFQLYAGWISVALIANTAFWLKKVEWNGFGISEPIWTIMMIIIAASVHLYMIWKQHMPVFALVAVWAFIAIAVANQQVNYAVAATALSLAVFIFLNIAIYAFIRKSVQ
ncbi:hypothetical protein [Sphingobacterium tabacisoli]|uniref:Tryptophan-rich sensory protein n=1 Tax=Sphingobacterium tabacisoli TaxID=2044855 RepID=A0ABW5KZ15_9SPHI|nr:hypothetical protein [Sphingobacterium tabacisoli]